MLVYLLETDIDPETVAIRRRNLKKAIDRNAFMRRAAAEQALQLHNSGKDINPSLRHKPALYHQKAQHADVLLRLLNSRASRNKLGKDTYNAYDTGFFNRRALRMRARDIFATKTKIRKDAKGN